MAVGSIPVFARFLRILLGLWPLAWVSALRFILYLVKNREFASVGGSQLSLFWGFLSQLPLITALVLAQASADYN
jgi:hypothetical protein